VEEETVTFRTLALAAAAALGICSCSSNSAPPGCRSNKDCQGSQLCQNGVCRNTTGGAQLGDGCGQDGDCSIGLACATSDRGFPGGLCTMSCNADPARCPGGSLCTDVRAAGGGVVCSKSCTANTDCRSGFVCCAGSGNVCLPQALCPATGLAASADLGKPCGAGCAAGEICGTGPEFPAGACTVACNAANAGTCPANGKCVSAPTGAFCLLSCNVPADCPTGYSCVAGGGGNVCRVTGATPACTPPGSPQIVSGGMVGPATQPPQGSCMRAPQQPSLQTVKFNTNPVGTPITVTVPPGTGSMSIIQQRISAPDSVVYKGAPLANSVVPGIVKDASSTTVYDDSAPQVTDPSGLAIFYGGESVSTGVMTFPNTSPLLLQTAVRGGLAPGHWQFTVNDFAYECTATSNCSGGSSSSTYDVQVFLKPGITLATGTVDVAFYLVGIPAPGLTSASAPTNARAKRLVQTLGTVFANAGLCLGKVTFYDVPSWAQALYGSNLNVDDDSPCGDYSQMFTLAAPGNQINYFLVNQLVAKSHGNSVVVGIDGTIPGPSSIGGTIHSGAVVSSANLFAGACGTGGLDLVNCGTDEVAYIAAHEGGHWMGLYHTTEFDGEFFDSLTDTLTCSCESCAPQSQRATCDTPGKTPAPANPTIMDPTFCMSTASTPVCGGGLNLMFWEFDRSLSTGELSSDQGQVIRANPVVR
jgi:hypothetical protein